MVLGQSSKNCDNAPDEVLMDVFIKTLDAKKTESEQLSKESVFYVKTCSDFPKSYLWHMFSWQ